MAQAPLVDQDIAAGRRVVEALDRAGFPVTAALWNSQPDGGGWRLVLASPRVSEQGPRAAYAAIQDVLSTAHVDLPLRNISAVEPEEHLVTELRIFAGTDPAPFVGGTRLLGTVVGDAYVEDAYVYRAERIVGKDGVMEVWSAARDKDRKVWKARLCRVTVQDGLFKRIDAEPPEVPHTHSRHGINAHLGMVTNVERRGGDAYGDVQRWTIRDGRLRAVDVVARGVKFEGYAPAA
jgi:hypothetical protein